MGNPNRVRASAGAEWLLGGFGLLRKAPLALGLVGLVFAIVSLLPLLFAPAGPAVMMLAQLLLVVLTPVLLGGMVHAVREVDEGRSAYPMQLLQGFREGKAGMLVAQLIPQIGGGLVAVMLLAVLVGPTALQEMAEAVEQAQGQSPDPALLEDLPLGALALWFLAAIAVGVIAYTFTFLFPAQVMFEGTAPFQAMKRSFRACLANIAAFLVFLVLLVVVAVAILIGAQIAGLFVGIFTGEMAAALVSQLLMMAVLLPVVMGASYHAWRQLLGGQGLQPLPATGIEL